MGFEDGMALEIPSDLIRNLEEIDTKVGSIAKKAEEMGANFSFAVTGMNKDALTLKQSMDSIQTVLTNLGTVKVDGLGSINTGLTDISNTAEKAANQLVSTIDALNSLGFNLSKKGAKSPLLDQLKGLSDKEQVNKLQEINNALKEENEKIKQSSREAVLVAKEKANATKLAATEETNSFKAKKAAMDIEAEQLRVNEAQYKRYLSVLKMAESTEEARVKKIERMSSVLAELSRDENRYAKEIDILGHKMAELIGENDRLAASRSRLNKQKLDYRQETKAIDMYNRAMSASEGTLSQRINKLAKLRQAEEMLVKTGKDYSENLAKIKSETERLNRINKETATSTDKVRKSQSHLMDISGQLMRKLALVFSVSQVVGYLRNLREVTGEFERQNVALATILQSKDKADKLFAQITELAVRSPFQLKELVTYTKSLSAYQIEYEKLFDTTKMLSDVSAGLGVSMDRLILAFGQVKAANFLRGTEVRQFTEAGFNVLGELAKYYSELENRAVSVGEVQEMVTKRMVKFGDVEEVFKRVTSAGGIFYQMQEKQAETLAGQYSNLQDSIDIMLNDIGSANQGVLKDAIGYVRSLIENWRDFADEMKTVGLLLSPVIAKMLLIKLNSSKLALAVNGLVGGFSTFFKVIAGGKHGLDVYRRAVSMAAKGTSALGAALGGLKTLGISVLLGFVVKKVSDLYEEETRASRRAEELKGRLNEVLNDGTYEAAKLSNGFYNLAEKITDATTSADEQKKALAELERTYGEMLPTQDLTVEGLKNMKGNYEAVTRAIYAKIEAQVKEKQITAVSETYGRDVERSFDKVKEVLVKQQGLAAQDANTVIYELRSALEKGLLKAGDDYTAFVEDIIKRNYKITPRIRESFKQLTGTSLFGDDAFKIREIFLPNEEINEFSENVLNLKKQIDQIVISPNMELGGSGEYNALKKNLEEYRELIADAKRQIAEDNKGKGEIFISQAQIDVEREMLEQWIQSFKDGKPIVDAYGNQVDKTSETSIKFIEEVQKSIEKVDGSAVQKEVRGVINAFAKLNDVRLVNLDKVMIGSEESMSEYKKRMEIHIKDLKERILGYEKGVSKFLTNIMDREQYITAKTELALAEYIKLIEFPLDNKSTREKAQKKQIKDLQDQINLIKKAGEEYKKLRKYYDEDKANEKVREAFKDSFRDIGLSIEMDFDTDGIIQGLSNISHKAGEEGDKLIRKELSGYKAEVDIELKQNSLKEFSQEIENLFSSYELSVDLDKNNIPKDLFKDWFKLDVTSLDILKDELNKRKPMRGAAEEQVKIWEAAYKKLSDMETADYRMRLEKFATYIEDYSNQIERAQSEGAFDINYANALFDQGKINADQYSEIIHNIVDNVNAEVSKINVQKFKESPEYIQAMGDMSMYSAKELEKMIQKIKELIANSAGQISAADLKVYNDTIEKINGQLQKMKLPWEKGALAEFKELGRLQEEYEKELANQNALLEEQAAKKAQLEMAEERLKSLENRKKSGDRTIGLDQEIASSRQDVEFFNKELATTENKLNLSKMNISGIAGKMSALSGGAGKALGQVDKIVKMVYQSINATIEMFDELKGLADSFGANTEEGNWKQASIFFQHLGEMNNKVMGSWESFKKGDLLGASVKSIGAVFSIIKGINAIHDNKREMKIKKQMRLLEDLKYAYGQLGDAIRKAYTSDAIKKTTTDANKNLEERNAALRESIRQEEDKKKKDKERIKEWYREMDENRKQIEENNKALVESFGGFGTDDNIKSAAEEFTSAWLDAYLEVGNGLEGLKDQMNDWLKNAVQKQLLLNLSKEFITPILEQFDNMFREDSMGGTNMTAQEAAAWKELYESKSEEFNEKAEAYLEALKAMGIDLGAKPAEDELSPLQKGIQGVTEQTAEALEAITESIRYFSSDSNIQLRTIATLLVNPPVENPLFQEMKFQSEQMRLMVSIWNSLTMSKPGVSGKAMKVQIV